MWIVTEIYANSYYVSFMFFLCLTYNLLINVLGFNKTKIAISMIQVIKNKVFDSDCLKWGVCWLADLIILKKNLAFHKYLSIKMNMINSRMYPIKGKNSSCNYLK